MIQHQYHDSPENSSTTEKRPPELATWEIPHRKGLHKHAERDALRAELKVLKAQNARFRVEIERLNIESLLKLWDG